METTVRYSDEGGREFMIGDTEGMEVLLAVEIQLTGCVEFDFIVEDPVIPSVDTGEPVIPPAVGTELSAPSATGMEPVAPSAKVDGGRAAVDDNIISKSAAVPVSDEALFPLILEALDLVSPEALVETQFPMLFKAVPSDALVETQLPTLFKLAAPTPSDTVAVPEALASPVSISSTSLLAAPLPLPSSL